MTDFRPAEGLVLTGDCLEMMAGMEPDSIDAIATDPPYGIGFMGKTWDDPKRLASVPPSAVALAASGRDPYPKTGKGPAAVAFEGRAFQAWCESWAAECFRVAKPGAYLLAFGGTRTVHRLASAIEDAGWEVRDMLVWAYASGFPKSHNVSKAIDKAAGAEREVVGSRVLQGTAAIGGNAGHVTVATTRDGSSAGATKVVPITAPATDAAREWDGWGTALKPAWEPIVMARKPLIGTVAKNVLEHGTGAINIDGCRIAGAAPYSYPNGPKGNTFSVAAGPDGTRESAVESSPLGRWPANVILTDAIFDGGTPGVVGGGERKSGVMRAGTKRTTRSVDYGKMPEVANLVDTYGDSGGASRFFIIPKSSRSDREPKGHKGERINTHPTVKPTGLMQHLVRLVTPKGGVVLDPFAGSGTTLVAAKREGLRYIGIEKDPESVSIIEARLAAEEEA